MDFDEHDAEARKQVNKQKEEQKKEKYAIDAGLKQLLETAEGRAYMWHLLTIGKALGFQPFSNERGSTDFNCGTMNVGQMILAHLLEISPESYLKILEERKQNNAK